LKEELTEVKRNKHIEKTKQKHNELLAIKIREEQIQEVLL